MSSGNSYRMGAKQQIYLQERSMRHPVTGLRLVCICTRHPHTQGHAGFLRTRGAIPAKEPAPQSLHTRRSLLAWTVSHTADQIRLPAPHPSSSYLSSCRRGENGLPSVRLQSLTHYFYFSCRQAIAKIPTHQHIHRCKLSCPQPPEKKQLIPRSLQCAILNLLQKRQEKDTQLLKVTLAINTHNIQAKNENLQPVEMEKCGLSLKASISTGDRDGGGGVAFFCPLSP